MKKILSTLAIIILTGITLNAQQLNIPLGQEMYRRVGAESNKGKSPVHTGFKPIISSQITSFDLDSTLYQYERKLNFEASNKNNLFTRKLFFEDLISVEKKGFNLYINPLFYVESGQIQDSLNRMLINTRGIEFKGEIGEKFAFYSSFRENFSEFRPYIHEWAKNRLVVPGQGATKAAASAKRVDDYSMASGYLSYSPTQKINIQAGQGKSFIGEGYRSMLLSDNGFNYPYLRASYTKGGFQYTTMIAEFQDFLLVYYYPHIKKHASFNYISYNLNNRIEIGLFEGIIYQTNDTANYYNKIPADFFIPIPGIRTAVNAGKDQNHTIAGLNLKLKVTESSQIYAQSVFDLQGQNRSAMQIGMKIFDVFHEKFKNHNLYVQAEFNKASNSIYTHDSIKYQTWTHYNQELAHPLGTRFTEQVLISSYHYRNIGVSLKYTQAKTDNTYDIYTTQAQIEQSDTNPLTIKNTIISGSWTFNPRTNLQLYAGIHTRELITSASNQKEPYIFVGIKTGLNNFYYDF